MESCDGSLDGRTSHFLTPSAHGLHIYDLVYSIFNGFIITLSSKTSSPHIDHVAVQMNLLQRGHSIRYYNLHQRFFSEL